MSPLTSTPAALGSEAAARPDQAGSEGRLLCRAGARRVDSGTASHWAEPWRQEKRLTEAARQPAGGSGEAGGRRKRQAEPTKTSAGRSGKKYSQRSGKKNMSSPRTGRDARLNCR
ncbi:hypothetical protein L3i22_100590 [Actinoplanes sp. L3-i22]|nr:hypothetical protein L3i22_100590 [Actinoplanes sp. L3-i22]